MTASTDELARLAAARWEADRHANALRGALAEWLVRPVQEWAVIEADSLAVRLLDQIIYRFSKLQDAVGERLVPATLGILGESIDDWPMHDRLHRLERLGYLDAKQWIVWRAIRNSLSHEYPDAAQWRWAVIEQSLLAAQELLACVSAWLVRLPGAPGHGTG